MDKLIDVLFSPSNSALEKVPGHLINLERENAILEARYDHSLILGDSNLEGGGSRYLKIIESDESVKSSMIYAQGLAIIDFAYGNYTCRDHLHLTDEKSFLMTYTLSGEGYLYYGGQEYEIQKGGGFVIDCRKPHFYNTLSKQGWRYALIHFEGASVQEYLRRIEDAGAVGFHFDEKSAFAHDFKSMFALYLKDNGLQDIQSALLLTSLLTQIIVQVSKENPDRADIPAYIREVRHYLDVNYQEKMSLDMLAARFSISKYHIAHKFKSCYGVAPNEYLLEVRIERARDLLKYSDFNMQEICQAIGISNTNHLYYLFKTRFGMSPTQFRDSWVSAD